MICYGRQSRLEFISGPTLLCFWIFIIWMRTNFIIKLCDVLKIQYTINDIVVYVMHTYLYMYIHACMHSCIHSLDNFVSFSMVYMGMVIMRDIVTNSQFEYMYNKPSRLSCYMCSKINNYYLLLCQSPSPHIYHTLHTYMYMQSTNPPTPIASNKVNLLRIDFHFTLWMNNMQISFFNGNTILKSV